MRLIRRSAAVLVSAGILLGASADAASAQELERTEYQQVISANPFGLLLEFFNAEYERVVSESSTAGIGGSFNQFNDQTYFNADVFWRFYVQGTPLEGWAFGVKTGLTRGDLIEGTQAEDRTYFGIGFDVNRSWLMGANENFYIGLGFGLKRLLGTDSDLTVVPTFRIVNVGFAF